MGLLGRLRSNLRSLRAALRPLRQRGFGWAAVLLAQLPAAVALRAYRRLARPVNRRLFGRCSNAPRLARFQDGLAADERPRLYVIVMPQVLHFLLPCLALLRGRAQLVLVANGALAWELQLLRQRLPEAPLFVLHRLPSTSVEHGDVISLLIEHQRGNFGIVDHDFYLFDSSLLDRLAPSPDECLVAVCSDVHPHTGFELPLTHLLYLHAQPLQALARQHGVDARMYSVTPPAARPALTRIGLPAGVYFKAYQRFHDTLHVLLGLALDAGLQVRVLRSDAELPFVHVGGTSIGSHHTKNLFALYVHLRFLDLLGDAQLCRRYRFLVRPLSSAQQALHLHRPGDPDRQGLALIDELMPRLQQALALAWPDLHSLTDSRPP